MELLAQAWRAQGRLVKKAGDAFDPERAPRAPWKSVVYSKHDI
jgi:hypothetical protein